MEGEQLQFVNVSINLILTQVIYSKNSIKYADEIQYESLFNNSYIKLLLTGI